MASRDVKPTGVLLDVIEFCWAPPNAKANGICCVLIVADGAVVPDTA
jgi:hypothetical protein